MWICSKCEHNNSDNQIRCTICGTNKTNDDVLKTEFSKKNAKWYQQPWFYIALIIVAMGIGVLGYHFIQISNAAPSSETSANTGYITVAPKSPETNDSAVQSEGNDNTKTEIQYSSIMGNGVRNGLIDWGSDAISDGDSVFFSKGRIGIYRMSIDGSNIAQISNEQYVYSINVFGEWLYYLKSVNNGTLLCRISKNGDTKEVVQDYGTLVRNLQFSYDGYYYIKYLNQQNDGGYDSPKIVKARITDVGKESVVWTSDDEFWYLLCNNSSIYAGDASSEQFLVDPETGSSQPNNAILRLNNQFDLDLFNMSRPSYNEDGQEFWSYNIVDDTIYYAIPDKNVIFWDTDGYKGSYEIEPCDSYYIGSIAGYWVFFATSKTVDNVVYVNYYMLRNSDNQVQCIEYFSTQY